MPHSIRRSVYFDYFLRTEMLTKNANCFDYYLHKLNTEQSAEIAPEY